MNYIVTFFIIQLIVISCPPPKQIEHKHDEFGREIPYTELEIRSMQMDRWTYGESVCFKMDTTVIKKEFKILDSAISFIQRGRKDSSIKTNGSGIGFHTFDENNIAQLSTFIIDSVKCKVEK